MFQIGDTVQLNSGGPRMTVRDASDPDHIKVDWFDHGTAQWNSFHPNQLKLIKGKKNNG